MKYRVAAELAVRSVQTFDHESGGWCAFHGRDDSTHVATVLVNGHVIARFGVCDSCARSMQDGTDYRGPLRSEDRVLVR